MNVAWLGPRLAALGDNSGSCSSATILESNSPSVHPFRDSYLHVTFLHSHPSCDILPKGKKFQHLGIVVEIKHVRTGLIWFYIFRSTLVSTHVFLTVTIRTCFLQSLFVTFNLALAMGFFQGSILRVSPETQMPLWCSENVKVSKERMRDEKQWRRCNPRWNPSCCSWPRLRLLTHRSGKSFRTPSIV